jgi:hypothetical protein
MNLYVKGIPDIKKKVFFVDNIEQLGFTPLR